MFCQNCGQQNTDGTRFCSKCGSQMAPAQPQQFGQQTFSQPPVQQYYPPQPVKPKKRRGCLITILVLAAILAVALIASGGSFNFSTAKLTDAAMASTINQDTLQAMTKTKKFHPNTPVVYATALLKNAPEDTLITAQWNYLTENLRIVTVDLKSSETSQYVSFSLSRPDNGFPIGEYEVSLFVDGELSTTLEFSVEK